MRNTLDKLQDCYYYYIYVTILQIFNTAKDMPLLFIVRCKMKKQKRILSFVIAACMTVGCVAVFPTDTASAVTKQEIANLKAESDSIGDQISDVQSELDELASREARSGLLYTSRCV